MSTVGERTWPLRTFALALALLVGSSTAHASVIGYEFGAAYYYPDDGSPYVFATFTPSSFIVGGGVETVGNLEDVTTLTVDFTDSTLTIGLGTVLAIPTFTSASYSGPIFTLLSGGTLDILSASVDPATTMTGFDASRVTFSGTQVGINWSGLSYTDGTVVKVNFTFAPAPVPEPSVLVMTTIAGLLGLSRARRRRQAR